MTLQQADPPAAATTHRDIDEALDRDEAQVDTLLKTAQKYLASLKTWKKAAHQGNVVARQKAAAQARDLVPTLASQTSEAADDWSFDAVAWLESEQWLRDVQRAAQAAGLRTLPEADSLVSSPIVVRPVASRSALRLGRTTWPQLRPRMVVEELKRLRDRKSASNSQEFVDCLHGVWQKLSSPDMPVLRFRDIYAQFCLTPGWKKDNSELVFAQALYALQRSDVRATRKGVPFTLEFGSGNVKEKDLFTVFAEDGSPRRYYGIRFRGEAR